MKMSVGFLKAIDFDDEHNFEINFYKAQILLMVFLDLKKSSTDYVYISITSTVKHRTTSYELDTS